MMIYLNGHFVDAREASVSVNDRGFLFGDGVYEVVRSFNGRMFEGEAHLKRMDHGLRALSIGFPTDRCAELLEIGTRLLRQNGMLEGDATVYMQVTRGAAPRSHAFPVPAPEPSVYLFTARFDPPFALRERGASAVTHPDLRWKRCDLKTLNLLPNCLAKQRAVESGATEAVLIRDGLITEGSHSNVFGVVGGVVRTHPKTNDILPGITRELTLRMARERGYEVEETAIRADELPLLEELFLTGTTTDILPIVELDGMPVGTGKPGAVATLLGKELLGRIRGEALAAAD
jgi:D-alanine transaminase